MGIRPSGLGLRLKSLQLHPKDAAGVGGDKCPLISGPFSATPFVFMAEIEAAAVVLAVALSGTVAVSGLRVLVAAAAVFEAFLGLNRLTFLVSRGLRLRVRALRNSGLSSSSKSSDTGCGVASLLLAADRVVGPKYPSFPLPSCSDGVGLGDMTRGVDGILCFPRPAMS